MRELRKGTLSNVILLYIIQFSKNTAKIRVIKKRKRNVEIVCPIKSELLIFVSINILTLGTRQSVARVLVLRGHPPPTYNCYLTKGRITGTEKKWLMLFYVHNFSSAVVSSNQGSVIPVLLHSKRNKTSTISWKRQYGFRLEEGLVHDKLLSLSIINILKLAILCLWHLQKFNKLRVLSNVHFHLK